MRCRERFAHNLKMLMERDGIRGTKLAEMIGVKQSNVSRWVSGHQWPDAAYIDHMCEAFGWKVEELFCETPTDKHRETEFTVRDAIELLLQELGFERTKLVKR